MAGAPGTGAKLQKQNGALHIVRHGRGPGSAYEITYQRPGRDGVATQPRMVAGAQGLLDFLDELGIDFSQPDVKGALEAVLLQGSGAIPEIWLTEEQIRQNGLALQSEAR